MNSLDGLSEMENKRKEGRRMKPPAPKHPPPKARGPEQAVKVETPAQYVPDATPPKPAVAPAPAPRAGTSQPAEAEPDKLVTSTIYFDTDTDEWIEQACIIGRRGRPKINSRSAFTRLAVRRLMEEMSPAEAVEFLRAEATLSKTRSTGGRPRR